MEAVIGEIGKIIFAATPCRRWVASGALGTLMCEPRIFDFDIAIRPGFRNDKILAVNTLYRSFVGVEKPWRDETGGSKIISDEVLAQFGSAETANEHFDRIFVNSFPGADTAS
jgi:hypothetical protein